MIHRQAGHIGTTTRGNWFSAGVKDLSTGATSYTWTNIPESTRLIQIAISGASLSVDEELMIRVGDEDGIDTSGYLGAIESNDAPQNNFGTGGALGFQISLIQDAGHAYHAIVDLTRVGATTWVERGLSGFESSTEDPSHSVGSRTLGKPLTQVQLLTTDGTGAGSNTFDAGSAELYYFA